MGANYYAEPTDCPNACEHCTQREPVHIGKSGSMLRGYPRGVMHDGQDPILSWPDWKDWLRENSGSVALTDEYGTPLTTDELIAIFESTPRPERERQYRWMVEHGHASRADWLDCDGFSFTSSEFS